MKFTIDVSNVAPGTEATLYFDLLGFGDRTSLVIQGNVRLLSGNAIPPTATDDTGVTNQANAIALLYTCGIVNRLATIRARGMVTTVLVIREK